jgi:ribosomal protein S6
MRKELKMKEKCYCVYREDAYGKNKLLYAFKKEEDAKWYAYTMNNDTDVEAEQCQYFIIELDLISSLEVKNGKTSNS